MHSIEIILLLFAIVAVLAFAANRMRVPYPLLLVVGGLMLGFVPHVPRIDIEPDYVFLVFLPPLLYYAAVNTSWRDFAFNARPIAFLSVGLTLITTVSVAAVAHYMLPEFSWPVAFVLGAIISPPDAIAATAIAERLHVPKRIVTILEGESLVNDAIALVAYKFAVAAVVTGFFSLPRAAGEFIIVSVGGIAVGYVVGLIVAWLRPRLNDAAVEGAVSLLTPYVAYIPAERIHVSGVLACVTCGLYMSRRIPHFAGPAVRIRLYAVWNTIVFLLNGLVFILIGLDLPEIRADLRGTQLHHFVRDAMLISLAAIIVRIIWVFPATYLPRLLWKNVREREPTPPFGRVVVVAWTGMRGIVSLAAALALPREISPGVPFPHRALILFITFGVILVTLLAQGLTLPWVIRFFRATGDGVEERDEEVAARYLTSLAAIEHLDRLIADNRAAKEMVARVRLPYDMRLRYFSDRLADPEGKVPAPECDTDERIRREALRAERQMLLRLRDDGVIADDVLRRVQQQLDLEEATLDGAEES